MMTLLTGDQVSRHWEIIRHAVLETVPIAERGPDFENSILEALLSNRMFVWIASVEADGRTQVVAVLVTTFMEDACTKSKSLLLYVVYGFQGIPETAWAEGCQTLLKWASSHGCTRMVAFTDSQHIANIVTKFGGSTRIYCTLSV